jgi:hypothetical protein
MMLSQIFLIFDDFDSLEGTLVMYFVDFPSFGLCLMISSWLDWGYGFGGGKLAG